MRERTTRRLTYARAIEACALTGRREAKAGRALSSWAAIGECHRGTRRAL